MSNSKVVGIIQVSINGELNSNISNVKIIAVDGSTRIAEYGGLIYEGEQLLSDNGDSLFQVKYLALKTAVAYDGVFTVLSDASVIAEAKIQDNEIDLDNIETAAGDTVQSSSSVIDETTVTGTESVIPNVDRGTDSEFGLGIIEATASTITAFDGSIQVNPVDSTPPAFVSSNVVVFDENSEETVIQLVTGDENSVTYSIELDLDSALFSIDTLTGEISFINSPNYENPLDLGADNEYNIYVTATDVWGNFTTQSLSININNINEVPIANDDLAASTENETIVIDVLANDTDVDVPDTMTITDVTIPEGQGSVSIINNTLEYNPGTDFDFLSLGDSSTVEMTYTMSDEDGLTSTATVTLTVTGTNDQPIVTDMSATQLEADDVLATNELNTFTDILNVSDLDTTDTHTFEVVAQSLNIVTDVPVDVQTVEIVQNGDGTWSYNVVGDFNALSAGESATVTFDYVAIDDSGSLSNTSDPKTITLTIDGTTDQEVVDLLDATQLAVDGLVATATTSQVTANTTNATADIALTDAQAAQTAIDAADTALANTTLTDAEAAGQVAVDAATAAVTDATTAVEDATTALNAANTALTQAQAQTSDVTTAQAAAVTAQLSIDEATTVLANAQAELADAQQQLTDATTLDTAIETATDGIVADDNATALQAATDAATAQTAANGAATTATSAQSTADVQELATDNLILAAQTAQTAIDAADTATANTTLTDAEAAGQAAVDAATIYVADATTLVGNADASVTAVNAVLTAADDAVVQAQDALNSYIAANETDNAQVISTAPGLIVLQGEIVPETGGVSVDRTYFTHNGGSLVIDMLSERDGLIIDNDGTSSDLDIYIRLYDVNNNLIDSNDDAGGGNDGSTDSYDSYLSLTNLPVGDYYLAVSAYHLSDSEVVNDLNTASSTGDYQITFEGDVTIQPSLSSEEIALNNAVAAQGVAAQSVTDAAAAKVAAAAKTNLRRPLRSATFPA